MQDQDSLGDGESVSPSDLFLLTNPADRSRYCQGGFVGDTPINEICLAISTCVKIYHML